MISECESRALQSLDNLQATHDRTKLRLAVFACIAWMAGILSIALSWFPGTTGTTFASLQLGVFFGGIFGHSILAASWASLGPGALSRRLPLSLIWCTSIMLAVAINSRISLQPFEFIVLIGASITAIWLLLQFLFWGLRAISRCLIQIPGAKQNTSGNQFGVAHMIGITTIIALSLGGLRWLVPKFSLLGSFSYTDATVAYGLLVVVAALIATLLVPASLLPRFALCTTLLALAILSAGTWWEFDAFVQFTQIGRAGSPSRFDFAAINIGTAVWILTFVNILRRFGYRFCRTRSLMAE